MVCPTGALKEKSHLDQVGALLQNKDKVPVAMIDPAVFATLGEFFGYKAGPEFSSILINALKRIGFQKVYGTGWGAEYQAGRLAGILIDKNPDENDTPLIFSECPSVVRYISQSRPALLSRLVPLKPANQIMAHLLRELTCNQTGKSKSDVSIVYLTSCTASKNETTAAMRIKGSGFLPDFSLTTREVYRLIRLYGIDVESLNPEFQEDFFGVGAKSGQLGAISGGNIEMLTRIIQARIPEANLSGEKAGKLRGIKDVKETTCEFNGKKLTLASISSITQFENYYKEIRSKHRKVDLLEVMACQHGCINGGGQPCRGAERNLRNRMKGVLEWDDRFSGIMTKDHLDLPSDLILNDEDCQAVFSPRQITK